MAIAPYVIFFIAGLAFGYAASGLWKWLPVLFPLALFLIAVFQEGADGTMLLRLVLALVVTVLGVLLGMLLERRSDSSSSARYA